MMRARVQASPNTVCLSDRGGEVGCGFQDTSMTRSRNAVYCWTLPTHSLPTVRPREASSHHRAIQSAGLIRPCLLVENTCTRLSYGISPSTGFGCAGMVVHSVDVAGILHSSDTLTGSCYAEVEGQGASPDSIEVRRRKPIKGSLGAKYMVAKDGR